VLTDDQLQRGILAPADTFLEKVFDNLTAFDLHTVLLLPPGARAVPGFDIALAEDVFQNVLQVEELVALEVELDELRRGRAMSA
jgi:hypothetical protein